MIKPRLWPRIEFFSSGGQGSWHRDSTTTFHYHHQSHWRRKWHPTPLLLPGKSHGQRSLVGCSPWGRKESDTTERLHFHFSFSCIGERNGNPLQCSCLENPRGGGALWAAAYGVAQSPAWLKRLSSKQQQQKTYYWLMTLCGVNNDWHLLKT